MRTEMLDLAAITEEAEDTDSTRQQKTPLNSSECNDTSHARVCTEKVKSLTIGDPKLAMNQNVALQLKITLFTLGVYKGMQMQKKIFKIPSKEVFAVGPR